MDKLAEAKVKITHVKPAMYSYFYYELRVIALKYGYNLVLHGSLNRDLDLIAIPWFESLGDMELMIKEFAEYLKGDVMEMTEKQKNCFPHGRLSYVINMNRGHTWDKDEQYYIDISVIPFHEAKLKEELLQYKIWENIFGSEYNTVETLIEGYFDYLKQRNNG
jgi:hypothetical protein